MPLRCVAVIAVPAACGPPTHSEPVSPPCLQSLATYCVPAGADGSDAPVPGCPTFDEAVQRARDDAASGHRALLSTSGRCGNLRFVDRHTGYTRDTRYFDARGMLVAIDRRGDNLGGHCGGRFAWTIGGARLPECTTWPAHRWKSSGWIAHP